MEEKKRPGPFTPHRDPASQDAVDLRREQTRGPSGGLPIHDAFGMVDRFTIAAPALAGSGSTLLLSAASGPTGIAIGASTPRAPGSVNGDHAIEIQCSAFSYEIFPGDESESNFAWQADDLALNRTARGDLSCVLLILIRQPDPAARNGSGAKTAVA